MSAGKGIFSRWVLKSLDFVGFALEVSGHKKEWAGERRIEEKGKSPAHALAIVCTLFAVGCSFPLEFFHDC